MDDASALCDTGLWFSAAVRKRSLVVVPVTRGGASSTAAARIFGGI